VVVGAVLVGNAELPSLISIKFKRASGVYRILKAKSKYDYYRAQLQATLSEARADIVENEQFLDPVLKHAAQIREAQRM
jgi:hypothetical protein